METQYSTINNLQKQQQSDYKYQNYKSAKFNQLSIGTDYKSRTQSKTQFAHFVLGLQFHPGLCGEGEVPAVVGRPDRDTECH